MFTNIRMAFQYMDNNMMKNIIATVVVWSPNIKKDIRKLENIHKADTRMVPELRNLKCGERLKEMGVSKSHGKERQTGSSADERRN